MLVLQKLAYGQAFIGVVTNWDNIEKIIKESFKTLGVDPKDTPVLITESAQNVNANREKWIQLLFESFEIPSFYVASQPYLSLAAIGRDTGMALCVSEGSSYATPVYESVPSKWILAQITEFLARYLSAETGNAFEKPKYKHDISLIKEKYCYIAKNYDEELQTVSTKHADWRDENITTFDRQIILNEQRFQFPEAFFKPDLEGVSCPGIHNVLFDSIIAFPIEMREEMCSNIVLSGGTTMMNGFSERLNDEFSNLASKSWKVGITSQTKGGSVVASRSGFDDMMISKDEYDEYNPSLVNIICFT